MKKFLLSIFAVLFAFAGAQAQTWTKVTDASTLDVGDQIVIVASNYDYALSMTQNSNNRASVSITKAGDNVVIGDDVQVITLENGSDAGTFAFNVGTGYLYAASSKSNHLKTQAAIDSNASWTITISDGAATVKAKGTNTRNWLRFNNSNNPKLFSCYSSGQTDISIYRKQAASADYVAPPTITGNATFVGSQNITIEAENGDVFYSFEENGEFKRYTATITIVETKTVYAKAVNGENESDVVSATFTRVAADPKLDYDATSFDDEITVSVTSKDNVYYTLDGTKPNAESTLCETALTLKATATLKVVAIDADGYASAVVEQKFTKNAAASAASETTLVTDASTLAVGDQIVIVASDYDYALSTTQNSNNRGQASVTKDGDNVAYSEDVQIITLEEGKTAGTFAFNVGTGYLYAASSGSNHLKTKETLDENGSWAISVTDGKASITAPTSSNRNVMQYNQSSSLFSCYGSASQKALSIYKVNKASIEAYTLSVSAAGWATLCLNYDAEIPAGVTCYAVSAVDGEYATLAEVEGVIPANTGVIVEAEAGSYTFKVATEEGSDVANELIGTIVNTYITKEAYVLGIVDGKVGLYKAEMAGGVWLNNANKAYLPASVANGAASYSFRFGEGTTGIDEITDNRVQSTVIYDLTGRRVENIAAPGIYIVNGKKVLVK
ncbi:MAG: chitobiase/beta-hexosaminidase C-terminal domain-containing protein [Bacteroidaceae bacterium]|nr:chitobiase/beta-hexosaminidase C-terminal domain-containing protein [Bacteroidaceae bacterium]